jgi:hypothetical protein
MPAGGEDPEAVGEDAEGLLAARSLELTQLQRTHDEYVKSSCEYERELETEVDRYEKKTQALAQAVDKLELDKLAAQFKLEEAAGELEAARGRHEALIALMQDMKWRIQRLEQTNDELETAARVAQATIGNLEHKADKLLEQTVFLQQEKEELQRQLSSITVAEVHPAPAHLAPLSQSSGPSFRAPSLRVSRKASSHLLIEVAATSLGNGGVESVRKVRTRGSYPDVVESCLHLTCRQCRADPRHSRHHRPLQALHSASEPKRALGFFETLRVKLFGPDEMV